MRGVLLLVLVIFFTFSARGQASRVIAGKVIDEKQKPLSNVTVSLLETNQLILTNDQGLFRIVLPAFPPEELTLRLTMVGKQSIEKVLTPKTLRDKEQLYLMEDLNLSLSEIKINAVRTNKGVSNSSIIIGREAILQTPALSLADILNELPGKRVLPPSLQDVQQITLRSGASGDHALSNANGVAILVDGNRMSNDANMQFNQLSGTGLSGSLISGRYGLGSSRSSQPDNPFGGFDLRQIPVETIESVEVVSGVASARYGDLTDGAIIVNRQAGLTPLYIRTQFRDGTSQFSFSKGEALNAKSAINTSINFVNSNSDPRDKIKSYRRLNLGLMYSLKFGRDDRFRNTLSVDMGRNIDGVKVDPDDRDSSRLKSTNNTYSISNRFNWNVGSGFIKSVNWNGSLNISEQETYRGILVNNAPFAYIESTEPGFYEGTYTNGNYYFENWIKGKPITVNGGLNVDAGYNLANVSHVLSFGLSYSYSKNNGEGRIVDPARPLTSTGYTSVYRDYNFNMLHGIHNIGVYIEDKFEHDVLGQPMRWSIGVRADRQGGFNSYSPRISNNYRLAKKWNLGLAYGLGYRAPSIAVRYPGPVYKDFTLVNYFPNIPAENYYLAYTDVYKPDNRHVKPSKSASFELNLSHTAELVSWSVSAYQKWNRDGMTTTATRRSLDLPEYRVIRNPGQKPTLITSSTKRYSWNTSEITNALSSDNQGVEVWLTTGKINSLATSFNFSSSFSGTKSYEGGLLMETLDNWLEQATSDDYAVTAFYPKGSSRTIQGSSRLTANTHIQPLSLMVRFTAEAFWYNRTYVDPAGLIPQAYIDRAGNYVEIVNFNPEDANYKHTIKNSRTVNSVNRQPKPYYNFNFSVSKEINKKLRFSFNAYNVFNHIPVYYLQDSNTVVSFNSPPQFGAEISLTL